MKKLFISIFLIMSLVISGLASLSYTPIASAIPKNAYSCDHPGEYIDRNIGDNPCVKTGCPIDFYCPIISGKQIENCLQKNYPQDICNSDVVNLSTDKPLPCPKGKTTLGFTLNPNTRARIIKDGDWFPVGKGATDVSQCRIEECPADKPLFIPDVKGVFGCYPINTCPEGDISINKDGFSSCAVACKNQVIVNGKCYQNCPDGEYLEVTSSSVNGVNTQNVICKKITIKLNECSIAGQVLINNDIKTCACVAPQIVSADKKKCELLVIPCVAPQTGNQPNCVNPPANPCPANFYGYSQPNCKPCPQGGSSPAGTIDSSGCVIPVISCPTNYFGVNGNVLCTPCPNGGTSPAGTKDVGGCSIIVTPCPANYYGTNGNVLCTPCPNGGTSPAGTKDVGGCNQQNNNGGGGFCSGFWAVLCGGAVVAGIDCFLTKIVCNKSQPTTPIKDPYPTSKPEVYGPADVNDILEVRSTVKKSRISASCSETNSSFVSTIMSSYLADAHQVNGQNYVWVATIAAGDRTEKMSTIRVAEGQTDTSFDTFNAKYESPELVCLMTRFAKKSGTVFGSSEYMRALKSADVLHGLNRKFKLECLNLDNLVSYLNGYGEGDISQETSTKTYYVYNVTKGTRYTENYSTSEEATIAMKKIAAEQAGKVRQTSTRVNSRGTRRIIRKSRVSVDINVLQNLANIFLPIKASALNAAEVDPSELADRVGSDVTNANADRQISQDDESEEDTNEVYDTLTITSEYLETYGDESDSCPSGESEAIHSDGVRTICLTQDEILSNDQPYIDRTIEENDSTVSIVENACSDNLDYPKTRLTSSFEKLCVTDNEYITLSQEQVDNIASGNYNSTDTGALGLINPNSPDNTYGNNNSNVEESCAGNGEYNKTVKMLNGGSFCGTYAESIASDESKMAIYQSFSQVAENAINEAAGFNNNPLIFDQQLSNGCKYLKPYFDTNANECSANENTPYVGPENKYEEVYDNGKTLSQINQSIKDCSNQGKEYNQYLDRCDISSNQPTIDACNNDSTTIWNELSNSCVPYITSQDSLSGTNNNYTKSEEDKCYESGGSYVDEVDEEGNSTGRMKCNY